MDKWLDRLNNVFAKLLGANNTNKLKIQRSPKKTSNTTFIIVVIFSIFLLWGMTGVYYLADNQVAIISHYGRVVGVTYGKYVGLTYPYPFAEVDVLEGVTSDLISINGVESNNQSNHMRSNDSIIFNFNGGFLYKIVDPKKLYINYLQDDTDIDNLVLLQVQSGLYQFIASESAGALEAKSLNELSLILINKLNSQLAAYGIKLVKLNFITFTDQVKAHEYPLKNEGVFSGDHKFESGNSFIEIIVSLESQNDLRDVKRARIFNRVRDLSTGWQ